MVKRASVVSRSQQESVWQARLARYAKSAQSVHAFCLSEAVSVASFYGWRTRLRDSPATLPRAPHKASPPAPASFIDLGPVTPELIRARERQAPAPDATPSALTIRLDLGSGIVLHIERH